MLQLNIVSIGYIRQYMIPSFWGTDNCTIAQLAVIALRYNN
jgi:hypothetical protein